MPDLSSIPWTWMLIRGTGLTSWALLTFVVAYGLLLRTRLLTDAAPTRLLGMHRWMSAMALAFLAVHLLMLLVDPMVTFTVAQILIPGLAPWKPFAVGLGVAAMWLMIPVSVVGRLRARLGARGNTWFRRTHLAAYAAWPLASAHYLLAGTDALAAWAIATFAIAASALAFLLLVRGFVGRHVAPRAAR